MPRNYLDLPWEEILNIDDTDSVLRLYRRKILHLSLKPYNLALSVLTEINAQGEALESLIESPDEFDGTCRTSAGAYHFLPNYILKQVIGSQSPQFFAATMISQDFKPLRENVELFFNRDVREDFYVTAMVEFLSGTMNIIDLLTLDPTGFTVVNDVQRLASSVADYPDAYYFGLQKASNRYDILYKASVERLKNQFLF